MRKIIYIVVALLLTGAGILIYWKYFYVFGEGVKSGHLNYVVLKGDLFKTYEGKLIQEGIRSRTAGSIQSYEFEFSVVNKGIAEKLMANSGKWFDLHYREFHNVVPWRGNTTYIVDSILSMREAR
ncbi:hypothetical protein [Longitalea arenae]|uniref:hypothetical protein n=1 Tax=Longitalea arenae TaxID=2812558 RepID=UPI0019672F31|nr:hypothetical protein [Longitalea arenae]